MNKISIIFSAYNAAKTVERMVRSVLVSTFPLGVWIVDDCSTSDVLEGELQGRSRRLFRVAEWAIVLKVVKFT